MTLVIGVIIFNALIGLLYVLAYRDPAFEQDKLNGWFYYDPSMFKSIFRFYISAAILGIYYMSVFIFLKTETIE